MNKTHGLVLGLCGGLTAGCSQDAPESTGAASQPVAAVYERALGAAQQARDKAGQSENRWTGAQALMENAATLAAEGKFAEAASQLDEARQQYELALAQAEREARDWRQRVVQ